ncbi:hypothetical protein [Candidatus Liberibacter brunswickensis]|uniref:hypothetical protein n=1 Tax=Candidatus Liberibacter brunswickensis TaxID=1968796 RepID=UPI002FE07F3F
MSTLTLLPIEKQYPHINKSSHEEISLRDLYHSILIKDFSKYGRTVIKNLRKEKPEQYLHLISQILVKENTKKEDTDNGDQLTDEQICEIIRSLEKELQIFSDSKNKDVYASKIKNKA